jgi:hypothetical protein
MRVQSEGFSGIDKGLPHNASTRAIAEELARCPSVEIDGEDGGLIELGDLAIAIALRAIDSAGIDSGRWKVLEIGGAPLIEHKLGVDTASGVPFIAIIDLCAIDTETGLAWLIDWKVRDKFTDEEAEQYNAQMCIYQHMLAMQGIQVAGTCTWQIRNRVPAVPKMLKNGTALSRGAIATDWQTYRDAITSNGLNPHDYADMEAKLKPFDRPVFTHRSAAMCEGVWSQTMRQHDTMALNNTLQMSACQPHRNLSSFTCARCEFREPCLAGLEGKRGDPEEYDITTPESRGEDG